MYDFNLSSADDQKNKSVQLSLKLYQHFLPRSLFMNDGYWVVHKQDQLGSFGNQIKRIDSTPREGVVKGESNS